MSIRVKLPLRIPRNVMATVLCIFKKPPGLGTARQEAPFEMTRTVIGVLAGEPGFLGWWHCGKRLKNQSCEINGRAAKERVVVYVCAWRQANEELDWPLEGVEFRSVGSPLPRGS